MKIIDNFNFRMKQCFHDNNNNHKRKDHVDGPLAHQLAVMRVIFWVGLIIHIGMLPEPVVVHKKKNCESILCRIVNF